MEKVEKIDNNTTVITKLFHKNPLSREKKYYIKNHKHNRRGQVPTTSSYTGQKNTAILSDCGMKKEKNIKWKR